METQHFSFDSLPKVVHQLQEKLNSIEKLLLENSQKPQPSQNTEQLLTVQQAANFLSLSTATIYSKISRGELPSMKRGKRVYFSQTELLEFLKEGRTKTNSELEAQANAYLIKKGK